MKAKFVKETLNENAVKSRGETQKVLDFIKAAGPEGRRYSDIVKFAYESKYGPGTYDADTVPTKTQTYGDGWKSRTGGNPHRGYWSGAFKTPSRDDRGFGHLMKYIVKNDDGNWVLRDQKMTDAERHEAGMSFQWKGKSKYKEGAYPANPKWKEDYDEKGNFRLKFESLTPQIPENEELDDEENQSEKGESFGEQRALELVKKYLPFINGVTYVDYGDRDNPNSWYGEDENYAYWDVLDGEIPGTDEGVTIVIGVLKDEEFNGPDDEDVTVKFYYDSVAFLGDNSDDEYQDWLEPINITAVNKGLWNETVKAIKAYMKGE